MRITADVTGLDEALQELTERFSERRLAAAVATALTRTAGQVRDEVRAEMQRVFDRPTPYTLGSLFVSPATATPRKLWADVFFKDDRAGSGTPATRYLLPQVEGGTRRAKRYEIALRMAGHLPDGYVTVPGQGARLDAYGNISRGQIIQVLSQLRITLVAGSTRNLSFDAGKQIRAQRKAGGRFFVVKPGARIQPGVYQRELFGRNITPVLIFVRSASYQPRLRFAAIARQVSERNLPGNLRSAIDDQARRLSRRWR